MRSANPTPLAESINTGIASTRGLTGDPIEAAAQLVKLIGDCR
jgi:hypothetical protein